MTPMNKKLLAAGVALAVSTAGAGYWLGSSGGSAENGSSAGVGAGKVVDGATQDGTGRPVLYWYDPMLPMERYPGTG